MTFPFIARMARGRLSSREKIGLSCGLVLLLCTSFRLGPDFALAALVLATLSLGPQALLAAVLLLVSTGQGFPWLGVLVSLICWQLQGQLRKDAQEAEKTAHTYQELLKTLVHELRNPLFAAKGTIENLVLRFQDLRAEQLESQLEMACTALQSVNKEVDDLTQLFRLEGGGLVARPVFVKLSAVYSSLRRRHPESSHPEHDLVMEGQPERIYADPLLLIQALDKLVTNAVVHSPGGVVLVRASRQHNLTILEVQDEGPGIPLQDRQSIFEREKRTRHESSGFGLGLYLAREYLLAQGGEITLVPSQRGCLFQIRLPEEPDEDQDHSR